MVSDVKKALVRADKDNEVGGAGCAASAAACAGHRYEEDEDGSGVSSDDDTQSTGHATTACAADGEEGMTEEIDGEIQPQGDTSTSNYDTGGDVGYLLANTDTDHSVANTDIVDAAGGNAAVQEGYHDDQSENITTITFPDNAAATTTEGAAFGQNSRATNDDYIDFAGVHKKQNFEGDGGENADADASRHSVQNEEDADDVLFMSIEHGRGAGLVQSQHDGMLGDCSSAAFDSSSPIWPNGLLSNSDHDGIPTRLPWRDSCTTTQFPSPNQTRTLTSTSGSAPLPHHIMSSSMSSGPKTRLVRKSNFEDSSPSLKRHRLNSDAVARNPATCNDYHRWLQCLVPGVPRVANLDDDRPDKDVSVEAIIRADDIVLAILRADVDEAPGVRALAAFYDASNSVLYIDGREDGTTWLEMAQRYDKRHPGPAKTTVKVMLGPIDLPFSARMVATAAYLVFGMDCSPSSVGSACWWEVVLALSPLITKPAWSAPALRTYKPNNQILVLSAPTSISVESIIGEMDELKDCMDDARREVIGLQRLREHLVAVEDNERQLANVCIGEGQTIARLSKKVEVLEKLIEDNEEDEHSCTLWKGQIQEAEQCMNSLQQGLVTKEIRQVRRGIIDRLAAAARRYQDAVEKKHAEHDKLCNGWVKAFNEAARQIEAHRGPT
ncbi:hypothetical protein Slin15195_G130190 [Septoria linicola]|uniref:Uncharacterized protein n=1 Tax=Septoria linicola TaxID=215465 RepID=A0A9Q9ER19_9PEZI|nr:hypothetical protein Slin14017_G122080 [Septoria linicola]USW59700.1 hypothetical protein Slin15195_G130190 [Septoria linicola]